MAERKAVNKYYPPDWEPKHGSLNKYHGQHPLRERARKLNQGIMIIRFEMPFNVWCEGCENHIGRGVRYNAEKKCVGKYYSTKIWSFRMKCHLCDQWMEIHTDPEHRNYKTVSGVRQKVEEYSPADTEVITLTSEEEAKKLALDPFYQLEHQNEDKRKAEEKAPALMRLQQMNKTRNDTFTMSQKLRKTMRVRDCVCRRLLSDQGQSKRKQHKALRNEAKKKSLSIDLLPRSESDVVKANTTFMRKNESALAQSSRKRRLALEGSRVFDDRSKRRKVARSQSDEILTTRSTSTSSTASTPSPPKDFATSTT